MADVDDFSRWISRKLWDLKIDDSDSVYGSYIKGILDSDESNDEKIEAIEGLLSGVCEHESNYLTTICKEVLDEWTKLFVKDQPGALEEAVIDYTLSQLIESQNLATAKLPEPSNEQREMKETILNQYSRVTDDEEDDCDDTCETQEVRLQKNTNAQVVAQAEKDKRQQAKVDSQQKKCKDKEDREKQKQLKEERKEKVKRKSQKVERKR